MGSSGCRYLRGIQHRQERHLDRRVYRRHSGSRRVTDFSIPDGDGTASDFDVLKAQEVVLLPFDILPVFTSQPDGRKRVDSSCTSMKREGEYSGAQSKIINSCFSMNFP